MINTEITDMIRKLENMSVNVVSQVSDIISNIPLRVLNSKC